MNENLNLCQILKDCPKGTKLWSPIWGDVYFDKTYESDWFYIKVPYLSDERVIRPNGYLWNVDTAECIVFPSKDQRDWSKFKAPIKRFDPKDFKPFDKVLIKHNHENERWVCNFFSDMLLNGEVSCIGVSAYECIPYNDKTKHLVGTTDECPEYYKWWEE